MANGTRQANKHMFTSRVRLIFGRQLAGRAEEEVRIVSVFTNVTVWEQ